MVPRPKNTTYLSQVSGVTKYHAAAEQEGILEDGGTVFLFDGLRIAHIIGELCADTSPPSLRQSAGHHIKIQCCQPCTYLRQPAKTVTIWWVFGC